MLNGRGSSPLNRSPRRILAMHSTSTDANEAVRFPFLDRELEIVLDVDALGSRVEGASEDIHSRGIAEERHWRRERAAMGTHFVQAVL
jgi:hypothetical protein